MNQLKILRENANLSQKDVSEKLGYTTPQFISNWERGVSTPPPRALKALASLYKIGDFELKALIYYTMTAAYQKKLRKRLKITTNELEK